MSDVSGTIRKILLDGVSFDAMADTNVNEIGSKYENTPVPTAGRNMKKMVRRSEDREGVVVGANGAERELLKELAERTVDFPMSYTTAGGDTYRAVGWIEFEKRETEENRAAIKMHPRNGWDSFIAP